VSRRPIVHQFTAVLAGRDAVGQHTLALDDLLVEMGAETTIFAAHVHPEVGDRGRDFREHPDAPAPDLIIYQTSIGSPVGDYVMSRSEPLVLNYHNMTPAEFFDPWEPAVAAELDHGRRQLARLARHAGHAISDSKYNSDELLELGMDAESLAVVPVLFRPLWEETAGSSEAPPSAGEGATILFVGRLSPNKCQQDLVGVLAALIELGVDARLILVGGASSPGFVNAIVGLAEELGVSDRLVMPGSVTDAELIGWYAGADVFVSMSEHEGFGVPVVEALGFGVPVVAFAAAAVPETLAGAGLLTSDKSPGVVAEAIRRILHDPDARDGLVARGRERADQLRLEASIESMRAALRPLLGGVSL
jgi:glycosyltransferase involved in cell wall biosynthesis